MERGRNERGAPGLGDRPGAIFEAGAMLETVVCCRKRGLELEIEDLGNLEILHNYSV
jgi:hypothetical protein